MFILFDIGATKMRIAASADGSSFGEPKILPTPPDFSEGLAALITAGRELAGPAPVTAVVGGVPGPLDRDHTMVVGAPNLPGWNGKPLQDELEKVFGGPVHLENDTALVGLGETMFGSGKDYSIVAYITVSTGVNGVRIVDGKIDRNVMGFEIGHQIVRVKEQGGDWAFDRWDQYIEGAAFEKRYGGKPYEITDPAIWDEAAHWVAVGLANTIVHWSPNIVVIGGSMVVKEIGISITKVNEYLKKFLTIFPEIPPVVKASLGDFGGLYGGLAHLKNIHASN